GFIASTGGLVPVPRRELLVSAAIATRWSGNVSIHSGRSILVAPAAYAAPRVLIRMSFRLQPASAGLSGVSGSHSPEPSSLNLATYKVPSSSGLFPRRIARRQGSAETKR